MIRSLWIRSPAESYQRLKKMVLAALLLGAQKIELGIGTGQPSINIMQMGGLSFYVT